VVEDRPIVKPDAVISMKGDSLSAQAVAEGLHEVDSQAGMYVTYLGRVVSFTVMPLAENPGVIQVGFLVEAEPLVGIKIIVGDGGRIR